MARDAGCFEQPALFPSEAARRDFFRGRTDWPGQELYDDAWGEVVVTLRTSRNREGYLD